MFHVELHQGIKQIFDVFYHLRLWSRSDQPTVNEKNIKTFCTVYYLLFPISLVAGAIKTVNTDERILLLETAIIATVLLIKFHHVIWKQMEFTELCHRICSYSVDDADEFNLVNRKLNIFVKVAAYFFYLTCTMGCVVSAIVPFIGGQKKIFLNIGFPLDYKNNEIAFWLAFVFFSSEVILIVLSVLFPILMWFLLCNCSLKYQVLGNKLRNMGVLRAIDGTVSKLKISKLQQDNIFLRDMIDGIESHKDMEESIQQVESFFSNVFAVQLATSALCICASVYCLAYVNIENLVEFSLYLFYLFYNIFDVFMIMYLGNEITLSSDRLSYCLFESDWTDRSLRTKECMIIFGERLKRAQELVILKLYALTLESFTRILNSAYSMFNFLQNLA